MHFESRMGHIGGNLSALDAMLCLHHQIMRPDDLFVLSKGHAAGALYITLWTRNELTEADLSTFHQDGTHLAGHPTPYWTPGISMATGSLGHGPSLAAGMALAKRFQGNPGHVYCLTSDGEWQEGANWEAVIFASHQQLNNFTLLVDVNGLQGFGSTHEVASMEQLAPRFAGFGLPVAEADGHDPESIHHALDQLRTLRRGPAVLLLRTIKGKGVASMENRMESHYLPLDQAAYELAIASLETTP
ncbi:MAG: transketolase [Magnetococcales bacterium]|nr:transketolase [Magnetococcales bacterium]